MTDIRFRNKLYSNQIRDCIERVIESAQFVGGREVSDFENDFAQYIGVGFCVGVGNGLDALRLSLIALGVQPGAEVIVPAQTFIATWLAVIQVGAIPVPVDVLPESGNIDPEGIEEAITDKTEALIAVHLHGRPCDLETIAKITKKNGIFLIEDSAQAHGAFFLDKKVGSWGDASAFSFYPTKNLGALGDAGCIVTDNEDLAWSLRTLRSYGANPENKYLHETLGWNSRMDPIQAAVLREFLPSLNEWNVQRQLIAGKYLDAFSSNNLFTPIDTSIEVHKSVWHHFVIRHHDRKTFQSRLYKLGVESDIHYPLTPFQSPAFREYFPDQKKTSDRFPVATELAASVCSLPIHPWIGDDLDKIIAAVHESL